MPSAWREGVRGLQYARLHRRTGGGGGRIAAAQPGGRRCADRAGCRLGAAGAGDHAGAGDSRLDADDDHVARGRGICAAARRGARGAGARAVAARAGEIQSGQRAAGGLRPRRALRGVFRPMPHQRIARPAQRQSRRVRAGLPDAVRADRRWRGARSRRSTLPAFAAGSRRGGGNPGADRARRGQLQDRGPAENAGIRGGGVPGLSQGDRCGAGAARAYRFGAKIATSSR